MSVITVNNENFEKEILQSRMPVLLDFWATWCGPCRMMSPIIDEIAEEKADCIKVGKVNVDENRDLAMKYEVMTIPTILIIKEGKVEKSFVGVTDKSAILESISYYK